MVVEEDIGAIIARLKFQIKILETTTINNKTRKSSGNQRTMVITTMVTNVTTNGIHHKLFATIVVAPAISNEVVHICIEAGTQTGKGLAQEEGTGPIF